VQIGNGFFPSVILSIVSPRWITTGAWEKWAKSSKSRKSLEIRVTANNTIVDHSNVVLVFGAPIFSDFLTSGFQWLMDLQQFVVRCIKELENY